MNLHLSAFDIDFLLIVPPHEEGTLLKEWKQALDRELSGELRDRFKFISCFLHNLPADVKFDAIISPANSFGRLDGAFDAAITKYLVPEGDGSFLTEDVQRQLYTQSRGFVPVGSAAVVSLPDIVSSNQEDKSGCKYIVLCPTMTWPDKITWNKHVVFNATWAMLAEMDRHNRTRILALRPPSYEETPTVPPAAPRVSHTIKRVLMPGLGTGTGRIPFAQFASQFALAVKYFDESLRNPEKWSQMEWKDTNEIHKALEKTVHN